MTKKDNSIALFHEKQVRRHWDEAQDGKMRMTDVADTESLLRLIQSTPLL